ncbi:MAG: HEAT repeat domain-containing protein [Planctomycetes bacterium]|nr:HEAT repeat domain-containing protein [Planctomycetota bacterium]
MKQFTLMMLSVILAVGWCSNAQAGPWGWSVGVRIGVPGPYYYYPRPWYPYPYGVYVRPYFPVYVAPGPIVYEPAPVLVQPVGVQPAPVVVRSSDPTQVTSNSTPTITTTSAPVDGSNRKSSMDYNLQMLRSAEESVRRDAAMELGRMKATRAVDPLTATLAGDRSPVVRDAAARALGLIASPNSLTALIRAAQADTDRDVRHSAQFAVEIIRTNLKN